MKVQARPRPYVARSSGDFRSHMHLSVNMRSHHTHEACRSRMGRAPRHLTSQGARARRAHHTRHRSSQAHHLVADTGLYIHRHAAHTEDTGPRGLCQHTAASTDPRHSVVGRHARTARSSNANGACASAQPRRSGRARAATLCLMTGEAHPPMVPDDGGKCTRRPSHPPSCTRSGSNTHRIDAQDRSALH